MPLHVSLFTSAIITSKLFQELITCVFISVFNQLDAQNLFHNKFYFIPLHVSSTYARNM